MVAGGAVIGVVLVAGVAGVGTGVESAAASSTMSSTTTSSPLTLVQWKEQYEPAIGQIADDVDVVVVTGLKDAKHPTKQEAKAMISACQTWHSDAEKLPGEVPPIPLPSAERAWEQLVAASLTGSSDCTTALRRGVSSVTKDFHQQLALVNADERQLTSELGGSNQ